MYKWIKIVLLALIFGMGYQAIDSATAHGYPMAQDQSYAASDAGVPCKVAVSVNATETLQFQRPYFMHPRIHDGAKVSPVLDAELQPVYYLSEPVFRIKHQYAFSQRYKEPELPTVDRYSDLHHNFG